MKEQNRYLVITTLILIVAVAGVSWQWYQARLREERLQKQLLEMQSQVTQLQERIGSLRTELDALDKSSFKGLVREANDAILSGWESLLNSVEKEVKKAREALEAERDPEPGRTPGDPAPPREPPAPQEPPAAAEGERI